MQRLAVLIIVVVVVGALAPRLLSATLLNVDSLLRWQQASTLESDQENAPHRPGRLIRVGDSGHLRVALRYDSGSGARRSLAQEVLAAGDYSAALGLVSESESYACSSFEGRPECWLLQAGILATQGKDEAAVRSWRLGADLAVWRWPREQLSVVVASGAHVYQALVERHPDRVDWRLLLMRLLWQLGWPEEAQAEASALIERDPQLPAKEVRAQPLLLLGKAKQDSGDAGAALPYLERAVAEDPESVVGYALLARTYNALGLVEQRQAAVGMLDHLAARRPMPPLFQGTSWGARLLGYDVAPYTVGQSPLLDLALHWQVPPDRIPSGPEWLRAGDHWVQLVRLPNLAPNAGFEQDDWVGPGVPAWYVIPNWMYLPKSKAEQGLFLVERRSGVSKVFRQEMPAAIPSGDYPVAAELPPIGVRPGECFLFDAEIRGGPGSGRATLWWRDENQGFVSLDNVLGTARNADPAMRCAPSRASWMRFVLSLSEGENEWDNILIVQVPALPS